MTKNIIIKTQFEAIHCWPECPFDDVAFLRNPHRHIFYVTVKIQINHNDRDVEFIMAKRTITNFIRDYWDGKDLGRLSCEDMAERLCDTFSLGHNWPVTYVSVFEDNENGAEIVA